MLTEEEWSVVGPHLADAIAQVKRYREEHRCSLAEARRHGFGSGALGAYERLTGFKKTNVDALFHHRLALYGPPCATCGKRLRTPQARRCMECGAER